MAAKKILAFGEILWDLLPGGKVLGGAPFNFAYRAYERGENVCMISRVGSDKLGQEALKRANELGIPTDALQKDETLPTGTVEIKFDEKKQPDYYIVPNVAYDNIQPDDKVLEFASQAECICFGTLAQRKPESRRTLLQILDNAHDAFKLLDINLRKDCFTEETVAESLNQADILKLNEDEAFILSYLFKMNTDSLIDTGHYCLKNWSLRLCLITMGERGVLALSNREAQIYAPGYQIDLIDPCGSGDAFTAGFLYKFLRRERLVDCCIYGNALGALVAAQAGATEPISHQKIDAFLNNLPDNHIDERFVEFYESDEEEEE